MGVGSWGIDDEDEDEGKGRNGWEWVRFHA
ncbi:MAG: hypothetical protein JWR19_3573 [Pedosphaera sp.]|nr:hypothetical protein [Pedosphaera sp.]